MVNNMASCFDCANYDVCDGHSTVGAEDCTNFTVLCKDCVAFKPEDKVCVCWQAFVREDDFCSYGKCRVDHCGAKMDGENDGKS